MKPTSAALAIALLLLPVATAASFTGGTYAGDGGDGTIVRSVNGNEDQMVQATTYKINAGVTMTTSTPPGVLGAGIIIRATNQIVIEGTLSVNGKGKAGQAADAGAVQTGYGLGGNRGTCAVPPAGGGGGAHGEMAPLLSNGHLFDNMPGAIPTTFSVMVGAGGGGGLTATAVTTCGGGGGGGATKDGGDGANGNGSTGAAGATGAGGPGGGFLVLAAPRIIIGTTGVLTANGTVGATSTSNSGAAGGGAGGTIFLLTEELIFNGTERVYVTGGNGGTSSAGAGGAGGLRGQSGSSALNVRSGGGGAGGEVILRSPTGIVNIFQSGLEIGPSGATTTLNVLIVVTICFIGYYIWSRSRDLAVRMFGVAIVTLAFFTTIEFLNAWPQGFGVLVGIIAIFGGYLAWRAATDFMLDRANKRRNRAAGINS